MSERSAAFHLAIDLGAGSGRAIVGGITPSGLQTREIHRFSYPPRHASGHLRWDFESVLEGIRTGIRLAAPAAEAAGGRLTSLGVDSWGVDYGLLDESGHLLEDPICYRDERTATMMHDVFARMAREEIFARTGIQFMPINTLYQLAAHVREGLPARAARLLLIPDLCHHALCGSMVTERTNASTTQLLGVADGRWDPEMFERLGLPLSIMPGIVEAGTCLGTAEGIRVIAPATHDTASAVVGTPLNPGWAFISSGTWSLVGAELDKPIVSAAAERENFTNEMGACGTVRFLKNVTGFWILEGCLREWEAGGVPVDRGALFDAVAKVNRTVGLIAPDDPRFFNPASMTGALRGFLTDTGCEAPEDPVLLTKVILDSLAARYAAVIRTMETLTGRIVPGIHIVGGGSKNAYLNQATADAAGLPVVAGPSEATAAGNIMVQAIAAGEVESLSAARELLARTIELKTYRPRTSRHDS